MSLEQIYITKSDFKTNLVCSEAAILSKSKSRIFLQSNFPEIHFTDEILLVICEGIDQVTENHFSFTQFPGHSE